MLEFLEVPGEIDCDCGVVVEDISSSVECTYTRCLINGEFFCGGGSFETDVDIESLGIVNDLTSCIFLTTGLPVGSLDDFELCYTAEVTNGNRFSSCEAQINVPLGTLTNAGGTCDCAVCPSTGVAVDIDCSMVNIGAFDIGIPGPRLEFCALADFLLDEALPTVFPALFSSPETTTTATSSNSGSGKGMSMSRGGKMGRSRSVR